MTLDEKIDETATPCFALRFQHRSCRYRADVHGTWDLEAVRSSRADGHTRPVHAVVVRGDHRDRRRRAVAVCVYECIGRKILRHAWLNVDLIWTLALLLISGLLLLG